MSKKERKKQGKNKVKGGGSQMRKGIMTNTIINLFRSEPNAVLNYRQVSKLIGAEGQTQKLMALEIMCDLANDNILVEFDRGRFRYNNLGTVEIGTFQRRSSGRHVFVPESGGKPINVSDYNSGHALDGDKVKVQLFAARRGEDTEAEVLEILEAKEHTYVGRLQFNHDYAFIITDDKTLSNDIFIPKNMLNGCKDGEKAIVRIVEWPEYSKNPIGEIVEVLGVAGNNETEMHAILAEFGLPYKYPENIVEAARRIPGKMTAADFAGREDFRSVTTFTIDPKDAKDFDDALSVRKLSDGRWEVGVHIADVTHYVRPGDIIDTEAYERATSVYLVDRTIPMLPDRLCNELCSLRQDEEKLCYSAVFELNDKAEVLNWRIGRTVIKSNRRFTYEEAQDIIETGEGEFKEEILKLNELAQKMRARRFSVGAIDFDRFEVKFDIDEAGRPLSVYFKESKEANHLVEEFMLLANLTVAESIGKTVRGKSRKTFVYRIHEQPDPDKLQNFSQFISRFGYKLKTTGSKFEITKNINSLLEKAKDKPEQNLIEKLALRSMQKARYSTENIGHYGLAFPYYTHFTSPIRRYPDMMVHRLLTHYAEGGRSLNREKYEEYCVHCSQMETVAANAERESIKYKQVEFMSERIGMVYKGVISGVTEWGLYVEINENKCEGLVPLRNLDDDLYELDEKDYCLRGKRHKHEYRLGDPVMVRIAQVNLERKQLNLELME